jgi:hypothetical protein
MTEQWPRSVECVTKRFYCDVCKEGTPHAETSPDVWSCTIHHKEKGGRKPTDPKPTLDFESSEQRHWNALDGAGNRGETPAPIQLREKGKS